MICVLPISSVPLLDSLASQLESSSYQRGYCCLPAPGRNPWPYVPSQGGGHLPLEDSWDEFHAMPWALSSGCAGASCGSRAQWGWPAVAQTLWTSEPTRHRHHYYSITAALKPLVRDSVNSFWETFFIYMLSEKTSIKLLRWDFHL